LIAAFRHCREERIHKVSLILPFDSGRRTITRTAGASPRSHVLVRVKM
jgi:hypothetical protein